MDQIHLSTLNEMTVADVAPLVVAFRCEHSRLSEAVLVPDVEAACVELHDYLERQYPVYVVWLEARPVAYAVARVDDDTVWLESLYVMEHVRRLGLGSLLFETVEELAAVLGEESVFNCVNPTNNTMIAFLKKHGYDVLNSVEIRKAFKKETLSKAIQVGKNDFRI